MRQTLLRIRLDEFWSIDPVDGNTAVGLGFIVAAVWSLFALNWSVTTFRKNGFTRSDLPTVLIWAGSGVAALAVAYAVRLDGIWSAPPFGLGFVVVFLWFLIALIWGVTELQESGFPPKTDLRTVLLCAGIGAVFLVVARGFIPVQIQSIPVYGYGFMLFLGFFTAAWMASRRAKSVGVPGELVWDLAVWIMIAGIGGARLFYVIQKSDRVFADKTGAEKFWAIFNLPDGGLVLYGGVILALTAFFLFCRRRKVNPLLMADVVMPSVFIGLAFGRLGCFLNGCCYGDVCTLPWAVRFPQSSATFAAMVNRGFLDSTATETLALHPTQIYSSLNALILAFLTATYFKHRQRNGSVLALSLCVYPVTRFVIEYLRSDELGVVLFGYMTPFTISQWISMLLFALGLLFVYWLNRRPAEAALLSHTAEKTVAAA